MSAKVFIHPLQIQAGAIDELGHVNNVVYLQWVQEAAAAHWQVLASENIRNQFLWVVIRHEIDYLAPAFLHDSLEAHTWVGDHSGATSERFVEIYNRESGKLLAKAKTTWCLLTASTMRPKRIDDTMIAVFEQRSPV